MGRTNCGHIRRGDLFYADLNPVVGSEQGGIRPVLVIQNDVGNHFSPINAKYSHIGSNPFYGTVRLLDRPPWQSAPPAAPRSSSF